MKLVQDEKELRQMADATHLPIIVFSAEGRLLYANRFSLAYGGLSLEDFQRDGWRERVYHPDDIEAFADARRAGLARGAAFESEVRIRRAADGTYRWFLIRYNPLLDDDGKVTRWYATGSDIDDLKRAKEQARNENAALRDEINSASMFEEIVGSRRRSGRCCNRSPEWPLQIPRCSSRATRGRSKSASPARFTSVQRARPARSWP
jgi:formate hydrogenlyase transcriptional activator